MSKERAAQLVEAGIWLKLSGDLEGARKLFERALKLDPDNDKARQFVAEVPAGAAPPAPPAPRNVVLGSPSPVPQPPPSLEARTVVLGSPSPIPQPPPPAMTVVLSSPSPVPQIAPVTPEELQGARTPNGEPEPAHKGPTMQFARPSELLGEPAARGATLQFARPPEVSPEGDPEPAHKGPTMMFARPVEVDAAASARGNETTGASPDPLAVTSWDSPSALETPADEAPLTAKGRTMQFARPPELMAAIKAARGAASPLEIETMGAPPEVVRPATSASAGAEGAPQSWDAVTASASPAAATPDSRGAAATRARADGAPESADASAANTGSSAAEAEAWVVPPDRARPSAPESWDAPSAWTPAPMPDAAPAPVTAKGSTMQFARPAELTAAIKAARSAAKPLEIEPQGASPAVVPAPAADAPDSWDAPSAWTAAQPLEAAPAPATAKGSTMQFARPPELAAALKAARAGTPRASPSRPFQIEAMDAPPEIVRPPAEDPASWDAPGGWTAPGAPTPVAPPAPDDSKGRTMQFVRPAELGEASKAAKAAPTAEPSPWDVPSWDASSEPVALSPTPSAPEPRKGSTMMFARPPEVASTRTTGKLFRTAEIEEARPPSASPPSPLDVTSWDSEPEPAAAPERWTTSDAPGPRSTQQLFRDSSISPLDPEAAPPSSPPLFAPEPRASKPGLQALGAMLGSPQGTDSPAPSSPPLFTGPAVGETPSADPGSFAWAWSNASPPPLDDAELIPPRPSPGLAPRATSAWDQRSNPGVKIEAVVGQDKALDLIVSDSKITRSPDAKDQVPSLLKAARDLLDLDDHTGAMDLILQAQTLAPDDPDVKAMRERSEKTLLTMYESKLGRLETVPRVLLKDDEIIWLNLDHRAGFVLAQIDGTVTLDDLFSVSGMSRLDTARILAQLVEEGVISRG